MIIAGFAGVGKTTFCEANQDKVIDFICMPYKYRNFNEVAKELDEDESIKANNRLEYICGWQKDYFEAIKECEMDVPEKCILIPTESRVLEMLYDENIPYLMVYPDASLKEEYRRRYVERGDSENFLHIFVDNWEMWMELLRHCPGYRRIVLKSGEYLSDVICVK